MRSAPARTASASNMRQKDVAASRNVDDSWRRAARGARGGLNEVGELGFRQPTVNDVVDQLAGPLHIVSHNTCGLFYSASLA
jgi:hypothetical protein